MVDDDCPPGTVCQAGVCVEDNNNNICVDGEEMQDGGMIFTCVNGLWELTGTVPDGTACDDGNPDTENDVYINGACVGQPVANNLPVISSLWFDPEPVTNETELVCLQYEIYDEDEDPLNIFVSWYVDNDYKDELDVNECFNLSNYPVEPDMKLKVMVQVYDGEDVVEGTYSVPIQAPSEE